MICQITCDHKTGVFTYDNAGNLKTWTDGSASGSFTYDDLNRKLTDTVNFGTFEKTIGYTWTQNSQKSSYTDPSGVVYNYSYVNNLLAGIDVTAQTLVITCAELQIVRFRPFWSVFPNTYGLLERIIVAKRQNPCTGSHI